jgi:hypothetical protein
VQKKRIKDDGERNKRVTRRPDRQQHLKRRKATKERGTWKVKGKLIEAEMEDYLGLV